jgi:hypothetical protein
MTAITQDQINQEIFQWQDLGRGFHGGRFDSKEICVFHDSSEICNLDFSVRQYTSDEEDCFGANYSRWRIIVFIKQRRHEPRTDAEEFAIEFPAEVGISYSEKEFAMEFCEYVLASFLKYQNLSRLPYVDLHPSEI